jgi:hypothetical protein
VAGSTEGPRYLKRCHECNGKWASWDAERGVYKFCSTCTRSEFPHGWEPVYEEAEMGTPVPLASNFHPEWPEEERQRAFRTALDFVWRGDGDHLTVAEIRKLVEAEIARDRAERGVS